MSKLTNNEVKVIITEEGIRYAVTEYLDSSNIYDKELAQMWEEVSVKLKEILKYLDMNH